MLIVIWCKDSVFFLYHSDKFGNNMCIFIDILHKTGRIVKFFTKDLFNFFENMRIMATFAFRLVTKPFQNRKLLKTK